MRWLKRLFQRRWTEADEVRALWKSQARLQDEIDALRMKLNTTAAVADGHTKLFVTKAKETA